MNSLNVFTISLLLSTFSSTSFSAPLPNPRKTKENIKIEMAMIASNIVNVNTTRTPEGGPYQVKEMVCNDQKCEVKQILKTITKYEPGHPDANEQGYVLYPDINLAKETQAMTLITYELEEAIRSCN